MRIRGAIFFAFDGPFIQKRHSWPIGSVDSRAPDTPPCIQTFSVVVEVSVSAPKCDVHCTPKRCPSERETHHGIDCSSNGAMGRRGTAPNGATTSFVFKLLGALREEKQKPALQCRCAHCNASREDRTSGQGEAFASEINERYRSLSPSVGASAHLFPAVCGNKIRDGTGAPDDKESARCECATRG